MTIDQGGAEAGAIDCAELERSLDAYLDGELADPEHAEASLHLERCLRCRARVASADALRAALRAKLREAMGAGARTGHASPALRDRVRDALARERRALRRRARARLSLAAVALALSIGLAGLALRGRSEPLAEEAVRKHARGLPLELRAAGADGVASWLSTRLDFDAAPPPLAGDGVRVVGARLSHLKDRPAAYVRYEAPRHHLGLFILDDPEGQLERRAAPAAATPQPPRVIRAHGYSVALWRRGEIVYSLVSDLEPSELVRLLPDSQVARAP